MNVLAIVFTILGSTSHGMTTGGTFDSIEECYRYYDDKGHYTPLRVSNNFHLSASPIHWYKVSTVGEAFEQAVVCREL